MIPLRPGSFVMGSATGRKESGPPLAVTLSRPFALARTETTFDEWQACVDDGACAGGQDDHGWGRGTRPVMNVSWDDAVAYTRWLSRRTGWLYRLPSEAEWEYAARAGTTSAWWFGETLGPRQVNCRHCTTDPWDNRGTAPVATYPANPWGFFDMNGNLWEWVADCWTPTLLGHAPDGHAVTQASDCAARAMRGGAWYYIPALSRSEARARTLGAVGSYVVGFRVLREPRRVVPEAESPERTR
ncbi:formylglycine-generating enzyme family protein [Pararhodospirillum oryzae]|nr:SUMF1/EgtB/PvdO family nonheme iron enzyme [Pararhodospirillum oryzae]